MAIHNIDNDTIEYVGILSKLSLTDDEKKAAIKDFEEMLGYFDKLSQLDTNGVDQLVHVSEAKALYRDDTITEGDGRSMLLENAPVHNGESIVVPVTVG